MDAEHDPERDILQAVVDARERLWQRIRQPNVGTQDEVDRALIDVLLARLELVRHEKRNT